MIEKLLGTQASLSTGLPASVLWIGAQNALFRVPKNETSAGGEPPPPPPPHRFILSPALAALSGRLSIFFFSPVYWTISDNLLSLSPDESRWFYHNFKENVWAQLVSTRPSASWQIRSSIPRCGLKFLFRRLFKTEHRWRDERLLSAMSASVCKSDDDCFGLKSEGAFTLSTVMFLHSNICLVRSL